MKMYKLICYVIVEQEVKSLIYDSGPDAWYISAITKA